MRIITARPPNYAKILAALPAAANPTVMFCYGDAIYNPSGQGISEELLAHEGMHSRRQGDDPESWWDRYLASAKFRFDEELLAHAEEYRVCGLGRGRQERRRTLAQIAHRLAGPLYGRIASIDRAKQLIAAIAEQTNMAQAM